MDEQKRLLLALVLIGLVVFAMSTLWPMPPTPQAPSQASPTVPVETTEGGEGPETPPGQPTDERVARALHPEQRVALQTPSLDLEFTTHGGGLTKALLLGEQFREGWGDEARQIDLVNTDVVQKPQAIPLAFRLVQKQLTVPASSESAEGLGVLRLLNLGEMTAERLSELAQVGPEVAARLVGRRPFTSLADIEAAIGGSASQQRGVVGRLLAAAWQYGYVQLDFELLRQEEDRLVLRGVTDSGLEIVRTISLSDAHDLRVEDQIRNRGGRPVQVRERLGVTGHERSVKSGGWFQRPVGQLGGICLTEAQMLRHTRSQLAGESSGCSGMGCGGGSSGPDSQSGKVLFVAVDRHYFMSALSPAPTWGETTCRLGATDTGDLWASVEPVMFTELPSGEAATFVSTTYLGPKKYSLLREVGPGRRLWEAIDYGWFAVLSHFLLRALQVFYSWVGNWGLSVIFLTFLIKLLLLPITHKTLVSMRQMQREMAQLKPQMDEINERYKSQPDLKQQKLLELYQQNGINPLKQVSGCLPMLLQMPIWIALYRMISESVELYRAPFFLWLRDLSAQDPYYILPGLLGVSMYIQQAVTPQPGVDNAQAKMMKWMMPGMFLLIMLNMPSGLVLYIFANTLLTIVQQQFINRMIPADGVGGPGPKAPASKRTDAKLQLSGRGRAAQNEPASRRKRK